MLENIQISCKWAHLGRRINTAGFALHDYIPMREVLLHNCYTALHAYSNQLSYEKKTNQCSSDSTRKSLHSPPEPSQNVAWTNLHLYVIPEKRKGDTLRVSKTNSKSLNSGCAFTDICSGGIHPGSVASDVLFECHFRGDYVRTSW